MEKKGKNKYGNVYEIKLPNGKYTYICWIKQFSFGVFNYHSEKPVDNLDSLLSVGFKIYISGKETAIRKKNMAANWAYRFGKRKYRISRFGNIYVR